MCEEEMERKAREQEEEDNQGAHMYQELYEQNATDEQIERASAHVVVGHPVYNVAQDSRPEGGHGAEFGPDGELTRFGWTGFERMLISKDARMHGRWKMRWRHLFDILFVVSICRLFLATAFI